MEPDHAHNFFIHQTVEQGFLGLLSSVGIFLAVFVAGGYYLLRRRLALNEIHGLVLICLVTVIVGRFVEMMVGVARVSDLTLFWVILAIFASLPGVMERMDSPPSEQSRPAAPPESRRSRGRRSRSQRRGGTYNWNVFWRLAIVAWLVGGIGILSWVKSVNYVRAAVAEGDALQQFRRGDLQASLASLNRAVDLTPDVSSYYNNQAHVYFAYRINQERFSEQGCRLQQEAAYDVCLAVRAHQSNLEGIARRPFYYRSRVAGANSAFNLTLYEDAIRLYSEGLELVPASWVIRLELANVYIRSGRPEAALQPLQESLAITGERVRSPRSHFLLGRAFADVGDRESAIRSLEQSGLEPAYQELGTIYLQLGRIQDALDRWTTAISRFEHTALNYANRGNVYREIGESQLAILDLDQAIALDPEDPLGYALRANVYNNQGRYQRALADTEEALRLDPENVLALANRGLAYAGLGEADLAIADLNQAINQDPGSANLHLIRGEARMTLGNSSDAFLDYNAAIALEPNLPVGYLHLGNGYARLEQHEQALQHFAEAIEVSALDPRPYDGRGKIYAKLGQYQRALADFDQAIRLNSRGSRVFNTRGQAYAAMGDSYVGDGGYAGMGGLTFSQDFNRDSVGIGGTTYRLVIQPSNLFISGQELTVAMFSGNNGILTLDNVFIGHPSREGNPWDFDGSQVRVTWDGGRNQTIIPSYHLETSDPIEFSLDSYRGLLVSWDTAPGPERIRSRGAVPGVQVYVNYEGGASAEDSPDGFAPLEQGRLLGVSKIAMNTSVVGQLMTPSSLDSEQVWQDARTNSFYLRSIADFTEAIRVNPEFAEAYRNRASAYARLGRFDEAVIDLEKVAELQSAE